MKISEFANKYDLSNDTVRYYMKLNLLVPQKKGGHYFFDEEAERDIEEILRLKDMGFSLQEIKKILYFKRIGKLTSYQRNNYYQNLYREKINEIDEKIKELKEAKNELEEKVKNLEEINYEDKNILGISLDSLSLFTCPKCQGELSLSAESVKENQVIKGSLNCKCGNSLKINNGIIYSHALEGQIKDTDDIEIDDDHIEKYIKATEPEFIDESYQSLDWLKQELEEETLSNKIILEPGSGYGYFLRQIYDILPKDSYYICVDKNPKLNRYLKSVIEMTDKQANIIFITAELPELPLKANLINIMVDFTGTSSYCFENTGFLPNLLDKYLKRETKFIGQFIIYNKFGDKNIVEREFRSNFIYNEVKNNLLKQGFELVKEHKSDTKKITKSMGEYEDFAQPGDKIYSYQVKAERWS